MKLIGLRLKVRATVLAVLFSASVHAEDRGMPAGQGLEAKLEYCKTCHGLQGQGYLGYFPMPRLAGQQPDYIEAQLRAFIERRRTNPIMFNVAHVLSPAMLADLATHFRNLDPKPFGGAPRGALAEGKKSSRKGFLKPTFLPAPPATAWKARASMKFRDWRVSSTPIP